MKWYCIKKYIPNTGSGMLIRANSRDYYERYFIATLEFNEERDKLVNWEMANGAHHGVDEFDDYTVTHFCPLLPVEDEA